MPIIQPDVMYNIVTHSVTEEARTFVVSALQAPHVRGNLCGDLECECADVSLDVQRWLRKKLCEKVIRRGVRGGFLWLRHIRFREPSTDSETDQDSDSYGLPNMAVSYRDLHLHRPQGLRLLMVCQHRYNSVFHICKRTQVLRRREASLHLSGGVIPSHHCPRPSAASTSQST